MDRMKRFLALLLAVCLLSCSAASVRVEAAEIVAGAGLTAASLFEICLFVGGVALTCYAAGEVIENRDEIAEFGKNIIDSVTDISEGWILDMMDTSGQEYIYGSEALELVQDTEWEVIQGGASNDNNDDNNDNKDDKPVKNPMQNIWNFTALGATWLVDSISKLYQKWIDGDELTESEQAALKPLIEAGVDQNDIAKQWSGESFSYVVDFNGLYISGIMSRKSTS